MKKKSLTHNFIMNGVLTCGNILFPLITYPYASRILKPYGMGTVSFANAILTYFTMFAQLGIPTYGIQICAKVRDDKEELSRVVQEILMLNLVTCAISCIWYFGAVHFIPELQQEKKLFYVMGVYIIFNMVGVEWLYRGLEEYSYITVRSIIFKVLALAGIFLFVRESSDYIIYGFLTVFALTGSYAVNFLNLRKKICLHPVGQYHFRRHLKPIFVFFGMSVATTIYTNMDSVMLGFIRGADENGYYDAAVKIKNLLVSFVTSLSPVLLPRVSYYWARKERQKFWELVNRALRFEILIGSGLAVFFILFARPTIYIVSGELYGRAVVPMQIIMPTLLLIGVSTVTGIQVMIPMGKEMQVLYSEIAGAGVNLVVNALLIPRWGASGAAAGTLAAELVVLGYQLLAIRSDWKKLSDGLLWGKMAVALVTAFAVGALLKEYVPGNIKCLTLGGISFFLCYCLMLRLFREPTFLEGWGMIRNYVKNMGKICRKQTE